MVEAKAWMGNGLRPSPATGPALLGLGPVCRQRAPAESLRAQPRSDAAGQRIGAVWGPSAPAVWAGAWPRRLRRKHTATIGGGLDQIAKVSASEAELDFPAWGCIAALVDTWPLALCTAMDARERNLKMYQAARLGRDHEFKALLEEAPESLNSMTPFGTWLHVAATSGTLALVRYLVEKGLDPNAKGGTFGGGAINLAASTGRLDVVRYLASCGAELDTSEPERNPLFAAVLAGHAEIVRFLLDSGIDAQVRYTGTSMKDMDAAAFARERGQLAIAALLEARRCEP